jgi:hypothetical protein
LLSAFLRKWPECEREEKAPRVTRNEPDGDGEPRDLGNRGDGGNV